MFPHLPWIRHQGRVDLANWMHAGRPMAPLDLRAAHAPCSRFTFQPTTCTASMSRRPGVHEPDAMPFTIPWTDTPPPRRYRESLVRWMERANWSPENSGAPRERFSSVGSRRSAGPDGEELRAAYGRSDRLLARSPVPGSGSGKEMRLPSARRLEGLGQSKP